MKYRSIGNLRAVIISLLVLQLSAIGATAENTRSSCGHKNCTVRTNARSGRADEIWPTETPRVLGHGTVFSIDPASGVETVLHSFGSGTDGRNPYDGLIAVRGTLYGTTIKGGAYRKGAVFSIDPVTGVEMVLHSFGNKLDGSEPYASLTEVNGVLYGTTSEGGAYVRGTAFSIDLSTQAEVVVHSFGGGSVTDGTTPRAHLIGLNNLLYGTTITGGAHRSGTVYSIDPKSGIEKVLYSFCSSQSCTDGALPMAGLAAVNGRLYGTTRQSCCQPNRGGTVFSVNPATGAETVVYSFCSRIRCIDGAAPLAALIDVSGILYGTTGKGGGGHSGTVFSVDPGTGAETVLYTFCSRYDCHSGGFPYASLIKVKGLLYGTTWGRHDYGAVFSVDPTTGNEALVYAFGGGSDGARPTARLFELNGMLYGTTSEGGTN